LRISLRPDLDNDGLVQRLSGPRGKQSLSTFLRKATGLSPVGIGLLQEVAMASGVSLSAMSPEAVAALINHVEIVLTGASALEKSISTAGGISFDELDEDSMLRRLPGVFAAGEMLDWEAPTGGYLLQASFATGAAAGRGVLKLLGK
jgi:predicted flavoprotein YhiN